MFIRQSYVLLGLTVLLAFTVKVQLKPVTTTKHAQQYLLRFGYLSGTSTVYTGIVEKNTFRKAVEDFQRFAGLNITGELDEDTMKQMSLRRCGVRDNMGIGNHNSFKRYLPLGKPWVAKNLTYKILKYPKGLAKKYVDSQISKALAVWSKSTDLTFTLQNAGPAHIKIKFVVREHDDFSPFDGPGSVLAHAFPPAHGGSIHFDDEESWVVGNLPGVNLLQVAAHEVGHSLGLGHSNVASALMYPFYYGYKQDVHLHLDDLRAIEILYSKSNSGSGLRLPVLPTDDGLCTDPRVNTFLNSTDGQTNDLKGSKIAKIWTALSGNIDDAFALKTGTPYLSIKTVVKALKALQISSPKTNSTLVQQQTWKLNTSTDSGDMQHNN